MSTRDLLARLWRSSPPLTFVGMLMLAAAVASAIGILADPRVITGAPAWMKPFKFAVSTAIYSLTLAWIFAWLPEWPRLRRIVGWTTAIVFVLEVALIDVQAWRGTTSHFNASTPLDMTIVIVMGTAIVLQTLMSVAVAVALWRQRFADRTLGWALRLGLTLTILGAMTGGLMTRPTDAQLAQVKAGGPMPVVGAHTVGGPDGGPGLPVVGWSREHGDLRVPHFIGLHAVQVLPLIAVGLRRWRRPEEARVRVLLAAAGSYAALFVLLLVQALNGVSLFAGEQTTSGLLVGWGLLSLLVVSFCAVSPTSTERPLQVKVLQRGSVGVGRLGQYVIVPSKEPLVNSVFRSTIRSMTKLPLAFENLPVPPVMVAVSTIENTPGIAVGVPTPRKEAVRMSPLAAVRRNVPLACAGRIARSTRCGASIEKAPRCVAWPLTDVKATDANVDGGESGTNVKLPSSFPLNGTSVRAAAGPSMAADVGPGSTDGLVGDNCEQPANSIPASAAIAAF